MKITREFLLAYPVACLSQVELFDEIFPDGAEITKENVKRAIKEDFDILWFLQKKFPTIYDRYKVANSDLEYKYAEWGGTSSAAYIEILGEGPGWANCRFVSKREAYFRENRKLIIDTLLSLNDLEISFSKV